MGIINRGRPDGGQSSGTTVIAAGSKLVGDLALSDNLHVDGEIEGSIRSESEVAIGDSGRIKGDLSARRVFVSGHFEGNVDARRLEIVAGGRLDGDVTVAELVIEPGALFNGNSRIREAEKDAGTPGPEARVKSERGDRAEGPAGEHQGKKTGQGDTAKAS